MLSGLVGYEFGAATSECRTFRGFDVSPKLNHGLTCVRIPEVDHELVFVVRRIREVFSLLDCISLFYPSIA